MWVLRIGLAFLLVILMGQHIPQIVHNLTPFDAKPIDTQNASVKFARSRMIDFFKYRITYDIKVYVHEVDREEVFGVADPVSNKAQFYLESVGKLKPQSFYYSTHNTTIDTVSVLPLEMKGLFFMQDRHTGRLYFGNDCFGLIVPGAEPRFNPLLAAAAIVYILTVLSGFTVEMLSQDCKKSTYRRMEDDQEDAKGNECQKTFTSVKCKKNAFVFLYWAIVVAVLETLVIFLGFKAGVVPCLFG